MTLNERIAYFQDVIGQTFRDFFAERGYTFREDVAAMSHEETQWYGYQAFSKPLGKQGYVHVAFLPHLTYPEPTFQFWVFCLRHPGYSPLEFDVLERGRHVITGYLPTATIPPLPLYLHRSGKHNAWYFREEGELAQQCALVRQRLDNPVLSWLECPTSHQFLRVEKAWYRTALARYVTKEWSGETAYATLAGYDPLILQFHIEADTPEECRLVSTILTILRPYDPQRTGTGGSRPPQRILDYWLACLEDRETYSHHRENELYDSAWREGDLWDEIPF